MISPKGDVLMHKDTTAVVLDWQKQWEFLQRTEQETLMVPLLFVPELLKCRSQVLSRPSCNEFRKWICHLREHWDCRGTIQHMGILQSIVFCCTFTTCCRKLTCGWMLVHTCRGFLVSVSIQCFVYSSIKRLRNVGRVVVSRAFLYHVYSKWKSPDCNETCAHLM